MSLSAALKCDKLFHNLKVNVDFFVHVRRAQTSLHYCSVAQCKSQQLQQLFNSKRNTTAREKLHLSHRNDVEKLLS